MQFICIAPRWHSVVNLGDVDGRIERPMVSDQARGMSGADATTSVWPYDGPTPTHSRGPCFPVLPLRQNCARKNKPWGQPLEQNPTDVTYCDSDSRCRIVELRATSFVTNGAHVALFAAMAAVVLTQEIMTRETAQTNHATPTHPRRASLEHTMREEPH